MAELERVQSGQRFTPKAGDWNAFVDAARYVRDRSITQGAPAERLPEDTIVVKNVGDVDIPRFGLLWITGVAFEGLVDVMRPAHPFLANVAIAVAPIAAGEVGRAWNDGHHPLRITGWAELTDAMFPLLAISQTDSFDALAWTGTGTIPVLGKLDDEPLVLADLTNRGV